LTNNYLILTKLTIVSNSTDNNSVAFLRLVKIMDELREQCPWDKKQTIHTLRSMTIEETYELVDAIDHNDWKGIAEELGDLFLHLLFYSSTYRKIFYLINISFNFLLLIFLIADSIDFSGSMILYSPQKLMSAELVILSDIIT